MLLSLPVLQNCFTIQLTQGKNCLIDSSDYKIVSSFSWYYHEGYARYSTIQNAKSFLMHRLLTGAGEDIQIDHRDMDGLNNTQGNLRFATHGQNQQNRRKHKLMSSHFKGVYFKKSKMIWAAQLSINKKKIHLGYFYSEIDAAIAYNDAATIYFGEFAKLNEI
jgi:hypothetical protein